MKKVVAILLLLVMALTLTACGPKAPAPTATPAPTAAPAPDNTEKPAAPTWPNGDVTILAGYAVGSLTDINIRTIADWITKQTGAKVIVENNDVGGGANLANQLVNAKPDGQTLMLIGMNTISNYHSGLWSVNPCDTSKFKLVCGAIQPLPDSGCIIVTQADQPYSTWDELAEYAKANPGTVTVASIPGKVMDTKMKALFNGTGLSEYIRWASTTNADAAAGLLGGTINIVMFDEQTATGYLKDGNVKAIINSRDNDDFSPYPESEEKEIMMAVPNLIDVFGEKGKEYAVPNRSMFVAPAGTPDEICEQIAAVIDAIDLETSGEFYDRCRVNGGTSKYYTWPGDEVMAEWNRLDAVLKEIVEMG
jgi:tripartite-type tricarboxylate transporter receptor subunit TctC